MGCCLSSLWKACTSGTLETAPWWPILRWETPAWMSGNSSDSHAEPCWHMRPGAVFHLPALVAIQLQGLSQMRQSPKQKASPDPQMSILVLSCTSFSGFRMPPMQRGSRWQGSSSTCCSHNWWDHPMVLQYGRSSWWNDGSNPQLQQTSWFQSWWWQAPCWWSSRCLLGLVAYPWQKFCVPTRWCFLWRSDTSMVSASVRDGWTGPVLLAGGSDDFPVSWSKWWHHPGRLRQIVSSALWDNFAWGPETFLAHCISHKAFWETRTVLTLVLWHRIRSGVLISVTIVVIPSHRWQVCLSILCPSITPIVLLILLTFPHGKE